MSGPSAPAARPPRGVRGTWSAVLAALLLAAPGLAAGPAVRAALIEPAPVVRIDGEPYIGVNAVAERLGATKYWRADVRKLVLRAGPHRLQLTVDNRFVLVDDRVVQLARPVRSRNGEVQVPVEFLDLLPRDSSLTRLVYDPATAAVVARPPGGSVGTPRVTVGGAVTRVEFPVEGDERLVVVRRARAHFQVRFEGFYSGRPTQPFPAGSLVRSIRALPVPAGSALALDVAPQATGYRVVREGSSALALEFWSREGPGLEPFAPEDQPGPRPVRVVVLDPGHGGRDGGARGGERVEKDLTLQLARLLRAELERRLSLRVVLTRDGDGAVGADRRAEIANRARADVVISLHFDGAPVPGVRGATAYCAPAVLGGGSGAGRSGAASIIEALSWRDVALRHAVPARSLAEAVVAALELGGQGPARVVEKLPAPLLGVNAPGILLECATLTAPADQARLTSDGLKALAAAIAAGLETYQRND